MSSQTTQPFRVNEKTTARYTCTLKDQNDVVVPAASLSTFTLDLYDVDSGAAINSRTAQNVLNANDVTVSAGGVVVWTMRPADNAIVGTKELEAHTALFKATWVDANTVTQQLEHEVSILVLNLNKVT